MEINLKTNTENPSLTFSRIKKHVDGSGYFTFLKVRSNGYYAERDFWFEEHALSQFLSSLIEMNKTLKGTAKLKPLFEEDFIELSMKVGGNILVAGELLEFSEETQHLKFAFNTDQTCLEPLITDIKCCLMMDAT